MPLTKTDVQEVISKGYKAIKEALRLLKKEGVDIGTSLSNTKQELSRSLLWLTNVVACEGYIDLVHNNCIYVTTLDGREVKLFLNDEDICQLRIRHKKEPGDIKPNDYIKFQGRQAEIGNEFFHHCVITKIKLNARKEEDCTKDQLQKASLHHFICDRLQKEKEKFNNWMANNFYFAGDKYYLSTHPDNFLYYTTDEIKEQFNSLSI